MKTERPIDKNWPTPPKPIPVESVCSIYEEMSCFKDNRNLQDFNTEECCDCKYGGQIACNYDPECCECKNGDANECGGRDDT